MSSASNSKKLLSAPVRPDLVDGMMGVGHFHWKLFGRPKIHSRPSHLSSSWCPGRSPLARQTVPSVKLLWYLKTRSSNFPVFPRSKFLSHVYIISFYCFHSKWSPTSEIMNWQIARGYHICHYAIPLRSLENTSNKIGPVSWRYSPCKLFLFISISIIFSFGSPARPSGALCV